MTDYAISQIIVGIAFSLDLVSFQFKNRKVLMGLLAVSTGLIGVQFYLLESYTAAGMAFLATLRFGIACFTNSRTVFYSLLFVSTVVLVITFEGLLSILAYSGAVVMTVAAYTSDNRNVRRIMMVGALIWITHNAILGTVAGVLIECFRLASNLVGYWRFYIRPSKPVDELS